MASILTIEDGTGVTGANSYVSAATIRTYASYHGVTLPAAGTGVDPVEVLAIKATEYIDARRDEFQGEKISSTQARQFPRSDVWVDGFLVDDDELPQCLLDAECQLACDAYAQSLFVNSTGRTVTSKTIGPLAWTYAESSGSAPQPVFPAADALLQPLLKPSFGFEAVRV
jgi:hypothetical protein